MAPIDPTKPIRSGEAQFQKYESSASGEKPFKRRLEEMAAAMTGIVNNAVYNGGPILHFGDNNQTQGTARG